MNTDTNWSSGQFAVAVLAVFALAVCVIAACWRWRHRPGDRAMNESREGIDYNYESAARYTLKLHRKNLGYSLIDAVEEMCRRYGLDPWRLLRAVEARLGRPLL